MLKVLGKQSLEAVMLGEGPHVGVEPGQLIGRSSSQRQPNDLLAWIQDVELEQQLFDLACGVRPVEQRTVIAERSGYGGDELDDRLMGECDIAACDPVTKQVVRDALLIRKRGSNR